MLAAHRPEREQALLATLELVGIEGARLERVLDLARGALDRVDRFIQRLHARLKQRRRLRQAALQPAREGKQKRQDGGFAGQVIARVADVGCDLLALHHRLPARGERLFLVWLDVEFAEFLVRMSGEFRFGLRRLDPGALGLERPLGLAQGAVGALGRGRQRFEPAIGVDQRAMGRRVGQRALVVLAVDLDQRRRQPPQRLGADAPVIDIGAGASVGELDPPQDQLVADLNVLPFEERMGGVSCRQFERRRHLALRLAVAHEAAVAARAKRQRQRIQKNGFSRPGLAGEDGQPRRELKIQLIDQHHIANGEARKHQSA